MKNIIFLILLLVIQPRLYAQQSDIDYYTTAKKGDSHFIEVQDGSMKVYEMGTGYTKAGIVPLVLMIDTLTKKSEHCFEGKCYTFDSLSGYLSKAEKKKKLLMCRVENPDTVVKSLNRAYFHKHYEDMGRQINDSFPLYHYSFYDAYKNWYDHPDKGCSHELFKLKTDDFIENTFDSISAQQKRYTNTANYIKNNLHNVEFEPLLDSLITLSIDQYPHNNYFQEAVYQMALYNPEYLFRIAKEFPSKTSTIYYKVIDDKALVKRLKLVEGYEEQKKDFLKTYRWDKALPFVIIGEYAIIGGLLAWLIIGQN